MVCDVDRLAAIVHDTTGKWKILRGMGRKTHKTEEIALRKAR